jgi:two-component system invasion response regulator UvrY
MIQLVIADDHRLVRDAWTLLLNRDERLHVQAVCEHGGQVVELCRQQEPDLVLMDINMEPVNGIEATRRIRTFSQQIKIIGVSIHTDLVHVNAMLKAGANGYVTKNSSADEMIEAIIRIMGGESYICRDVHWGSEE